MNEVLTIITLTKNSEKFIADCIKSLNVAIEQCDPNLVKHIVIDANSSDKTIDIIKNLIPKSEIYYQKCDPGLYNAINYGIKEIVSTPYVCYLHSDDMIEKNFLNVMTRSIIENIDKKNYLYVGSVTFIDEYNKKLYTRRPPYYFEFIQKKNNLIFHPNAIYPTEIEKKFPYKDSEFSRKADGHHILEIMRECKQIRKVRAIYKFRLSNKSWTYNESKKNKQDKSFFSRIYINLFEDMIFKRIILKFFGKSYWS